MAGGDPTNPLFAQFIDEYFAECDEHLVIARSSLLALEGAGTTAPVNRELLDELFRSFHSIKGLSAMVGMQAAEQLAHHMESYLSALRKEQVRPTSTGWETLIEGVRTLEGVIVAWKEHTEPHPVDSLLLKLEGLLPATNTSSGTAPAAGQPGSINLSPEKTALLTALVSQGRGSGALRSRPPRHLPSAASMSIRCASGYKRPANCCRPYRTCCPAAKLPLVFSLPVCDRKLPSRTGGPTG